MKMITEYKQGMRIYLYRKMGGGANGVIPEMDRILDELFHKADSLDRATKHIATERWNLAEDLIGEDDEDVRRQILAELAVLQRIKDVMECESKRKGRGETFGGGARASKDLAYRRARHGMD